MINAPATHPLPRYPDQRPVHVGDVVQYQGARIGVVERMLPVTVAASVYVRFATGRIWCKPSHLAWIEARP